MFYAVPERTQKFSEQAISEFNRLRQEALMARRDLTIHREA